jgi:hypothetical protein
MEIITKLIQMKGKGLNPTREELLSAVTFVQSKDMEGVNGVFCNNSIYIRNNLSNEAKLFVSRHELDHAFQRAGLENDCSQTEYCAVKYAAIEYPIGFLETIISSLITAYNDMPDKQCFLFSSWDIFRTYIMP